MTKATLALLVLTAVNTMLAKAAGLSPWAGIPLAMAVAWLMLFGAIFVWQALFVIPRKMWAEERDRADAAEAELARTPPANTNSSLGGRHE